MKVKRYTRKFYAAVELAQADADRTGTTQNVIETVYGVFYGPTTKYPAGGWGYNSTVVRPR